MDKRWTKIGQWTRRGALAIGAAAMLVTGGCADDGAKGDDARKPSTVSMRIVGGSMESGFAAVGALVDNSGAFCTGTLVAPTTVVTAAHCIEGATSPAGMSFFVGQDANSGSGTKVSIASLHPHPEYDGVNDIAVLKLAEAPPVTPIPYLKSAMGNDWVGKSAIFVGYGVTAADRSDAGVKRSVAIDISKIMETAFEYVSSTKNTCFGDSGGPALAKVGGQFHLLGVTSYGDENCAEYGVNNRVDTYREWIDGLIAQSGESAPPSATPGEPTEPGDEDICAAQNWYGDGVCDHGCANPDPDCEGMEDEPVPDCGGAAQGGEDVCEAEGWYGDGVCDLGCANPDPDCEGMDDPCEFGYCDDGDGADPGADDGNPGDEDVCEAQGWYGDGVCDEDCARPEPGL